MVNEFDLELFGSKNPVIWRRFLSPMIVPSWNSTTHSKSFLIGKIATCSVLNRNEIEETAHRR